MIFDREAALRAFGKEHILQATIEVFLSQAPAMLARLHEPGDLVETAHWLKGGFATLHAPAAREAAERLERQARAGGETGAARQALDEEIVRLCRYLEEGCPPPH